MSSIAIGSAAANSKEPIALVGISTRFPGHAHSPAEFWELLKSGFDGIIEVPPDRWDASFFADPTRRLPGKTASRKSGFLQEDINLWDAPFFGVSPREARQMDPQQRSLFCDLLSFLHVLACIFMSSHSSLWFVLRV